MASGTRRWIGLVVISLAVALIIVDSTIVNVAIPSIVDDLGITSTQVQWVQESYTIVFAALLLTFGTIADRVGRRRMMLIGITIFSLASVAAALAPNGELLILSRVVQGVGGAMILPTSLSIINANFHGRERGIAFAVWGSTIGGMAAVGPLLGGWLTTDYSWRWAFGINVPLGIITIVGALLTVAESRADHPMRLDVVGALLSVITSASLVFALIEGRTYGWWETESPLMFGDWEWTFPISPIPFVFAIAVLSGIGFVAWGLARQRRGRDPMLPFALFRIPSFRNGNIAALIVSLGEFGIILSLPLWLQNVLGYDALQTGYVLLGLAIGAFAASGVAGSLGQRVPPVWTVRVGILLEIAGLVVIALVISTDTPWWQIVLGLFVYGFGVGLATAQLTGVVLADVPVAQSGTASGTQSTSRQFGSALGIAILGTVLFTSLAAGLDAKLEPIVPEPPREQVVDAVVDSAGAAIPAIEAQSPEAAQAAREAFSDATRNSALAAAGFLAIGLLSTVSLGSGRREVDDDPTDQHGSGTAGGGDDAGGGEPGDAVRAAPGGAPD